MSNAVDNGDDETHDGYPIPNSARMMQQELRYLRQNYQGLKTAVDKILDDHETRIRGLEFRIWLAMGGGAVIGWLASLLIKH